MVTLWLASVVLALTVARNLPLVPATVVSVQTACGQPLPTMILALGWAVPFTVIFAPRVSPSSAVAGMTSPLVGEVMCGCARVGTVGSGASAVGLSPEPQPSTARHAIVTSRRRMRALRTVALADDPVRPQPLEDQVGGDPRAGDVEMDAVALADDAAVDGGAEHAAGREHRDQV